MYTKLLASLSPTRFARYALAISAAWLLLIYPMLNYFAWDHMPLRARPNGSDFSQYYSGALAVRTNMRECLYPQVNAHLYSSPPTFRPLFITPFFNPDADASRSGMWPFYPQVARPGASKVSEKLTSQCQRLQGDWHYVSPPPLALLLAPLALFDYTTACRAIWFTLMCASLFGISYYSARICRILFQGATYIEGISVLLPAVPTWLASGMANSLCVGNASPLLGLLVTLVAYAFLTNKQALIALCIIPLILFKGIGITWCLLLIIGHIKWRTISFMVFLTLTLNGLAVYIGGVELYQTFFREILPKANIPLGIGIQGMLMGVLGVDSEFISIIARILILPVIYYYYYKALRQGHNHGVTALAAIIATVAMFNLLNPIVWPDYFSCYLILPFAPWIMREILLRHGRMRVLLATFASTTVLCWTDSIIFARDSLMVVCLKDLNLDSVVIEILRKTSCAISLYVIPNTVAVLILILAIRRLMICSATQAAAVPCSGH